MVLAYHLQHPHLYSPEGLAYARRLFEDFMAGLAPAAARARGRAYLGSDVRTWKVTDRPGAEAGSYAEQPVWRMTVADVVAAGLDGAAEAAECWARTVETSLQRAHAHSA